MPFDAVAFFIEVAQTLEKGKLEKDLNKLYRLRDFDCSKRFGMTVTGKLSINRPLKTLFYYEMKIAFEAMHELLTKNLDAWDLLLVLSDNILLGNPQLPVVKANSPTGGMIAIKSNLFLNYILLTQSSMTFAPITDTGSVFVRLMQGK